MTEQGNKIDWNRINGNNCILFVQRMSLLVKSLVERRLEGSTRDDKNHKSDLEE